MSYGPLDLRDLQAEVGAWADRNFGSGDENPSYRCILGMVEEIGELSHAFLKGEQGIRYTEDEARAMIVDGLGDLLIFVLHFCHKEGYDLETVLSETWAEVRERDWKNNPKDAHKETTNGH